MGNLLVVVRGEEESHTYINRKNSPEPDMALRFS
jgi:hypothetical protein